MTTDENMALTRFPVLSLAGTAPVSFSIACNRTIRLSER